MVFEMEGRRLYARFFNSLQFGTVSVNDILLLLLGL